jgi:tetratricopeptide (TPR) repeat protein
MEATSRFRIGEAAYFSGDFGRAEFALRDFSERFPQNGLLKYALPYLSDLAFRRQDYDEVIRIACQYQDRETTDDFPIDFNVHFRAAQANHYLGRFEAVQSICREMSHQRMLIESDLGHEFALVAAEAAWAQEGCNQTIRSFQRIAASQAPRELRCRAMIRAAECLCDLGEFTAAIDQYLTIIVEYPNEPVAELAAQRITKLQNHRMANTVAQPCKVDLS